MELGHFSPDKIKTVLNHHGGIAYNDKYIVTINKPPGFDLPGGAQIRKQLTMLCDTATLPTKSLATFEKSI